jgi:hypothetical protein
MKLLLVVLFLLLAVPLAIAPSLSFAVEFNCGSRSVAAFGRCADGLVQTGVGLAWA